MPRRFERATSGEIRSALGKVTAYMRKYLPVVLFALVLAALGAVLTIIGPDQIGKITEIMSAGLVGPIDMNAIGEVGLRLLCIYGFSALFTFLDHFMMATVTLRTSKQLR